MERTTFDAFSSVAFLWRMLDLPQEALDSLDLPSDGECLPSSFRVDVLAQSTVAASALVAALFWSHRNGCSMPRVTVPAEHACVEFKSERLYTLNGKAASPPWGAIGGFYQAADGYVRIHDSFPNHREIALRILGLPQDASKEVVAQEVSRWKSVELEAKGFRSGAVIAALRSLDQWDALPQGKAIADHPVLLTRLATSELRMPLARTPKVMGKCLEGIRVVEMSRVIAAPVAGKTLAAHGADVIWITSPHLPDLPDLDIDLSRGKRTVQLDISKAEGRAKLLDLLSTADVFLQSYRPGSLAAKGLSAEELTKANPSLIVASLSAYGPGNSWSLNRGFDSLVQTCCGINVAEAERYGAGEPIRILPCQAFDHGAGYLLATGIMAALYKRATAGGAYEVIVSLAGVMKFMRSLGRYDGKSGFDRKDFKSPEDVKRYLELRQTHFGELKAVTHSARIKGLSVGWDVMPKPLGSDTAHWL
ncbi:CoA-transferase family III domain-containing protein [Alternaria rosae]|uniref:CoA-transferase family III domain-containing protein n=1 Tax=Alternaria rosae TaxID=1187941 RepID=UPI001E8D626F|nr:CoA-transferase family III domain-containing protein [Alternaria rosae]KAH6877569.1 CoA-transferase family III domain-containing protein [Alternaria rosae]